MPDAPHVVAWTDHALVKAGLLGLARIDVEDAVLEHYAARTRNTGAADWLIIVGRLAVAFNHPDDDDPTTARRNPLATGIGLGR